MWSLIIAACVGIFSSMFNISAPASMARYDNDEAPAYRQEYNNSYFESGFQRNDESTTSDIVGNTSESSPETFSVAGVYIPPKTDISSATAPENGKNGYDSLTVLSGE